MGFRRLGRSGLTVSALPYRDGGGPGPTGPPRRRDGPGGVVRPCCGGTGAGASRLAARADPLSGGRRVSWRILLEDLAAGWAQLTGNQPVALPEAGTSFRRWARLLVEQSRGPARVAELAMWQEVLKDAALRTRGSGRPRPSRATRRSGGSVPHSGSVHQHLPGTPRHNRHRSHRSVHWRPDSRPSAKKVKEQLRVVPDYGLGFGLLRYLNPKTTAILGELPAAQIIF